MLETQPNCASGAGAPFRAPNALLRCADGGQRVACARTARPRVEESAIQPSLIDRLRQFLAGSSIAFVVPAVMPFPPLAVMDQAGILAMVLSLALLVLSLGIHEAAHAWAALKCGDTTARDMGRLTLNPIPHIDLWWTILLPGLLYFSTGGRFIFGGAKPVPVDFHRLRNPWRDMSFVAFMGPLSNLLLVGVFVALWKFFVQTGYYNGAADSLFARQDQLLPTVMKSAAGFNALLFVFNLIPVPPLDGSRIMTWLLPANMREPYNSVGLFGIVGVVLLMQWDPFAYQVVRLMRIILVSAETVVSLGGLW